MTQANNSQLETLRDISRALIYAEEEGKKLRHGSTTAEYEAARMLGQGLSAPGQDVFGDPKYTDVRAVRDLPEEQGIELIVYYNFRLRRMTMSFDELRDASNHPDAKEALYARWHSELRGTASIVGATPTAQKTAKSKTKRGLTTADGATLEVISEKRKRG